MNPNGDIEEWRDAFFDLIEDQQPTELPSRNAPSQLPPGYHYEPKEPHCENPEDLSDRKA